MTYHPNDLRDAVDALTLEVREPVTRVINGTTRTERVTQPTPARAARGSDPRVDAFRVGCVIEPARYGDPARR